MFFRIQGVLLNILPLKNIKICVLLRKEAMYHTNLKPLGAKSDLIAGNPWDADSSKEKRVYINFKIYFHFQ